MAVRRSPADYALGRNDSASTLSVGEAFWCHSDTMQRRKDEATPKRAEILNVSGGVLSLKASGRLTQAEVAAAQQAAGKIVFRSNISRQGRGPAPGSLKSDHNSYGEETHMESIYRMIIVLAGCVALSSPALAQSSSRGTGWEYGIDAVYFPSTDVDFEGGSSLSVDDDLALTLVFGYRLNSRVEIGFALDWQSADYDATIQSADLPGLSVDVNGEYEIFTPRVNVNYNFLDSNLTPYVTGGIGWAFIDTNIPEGRVEVGCWWDPWYGQICVPVQDTRSTDAFTYQLGAGVRWDASRGLSMRLGYEKHWYDFDKASSTPDFDQFKLGVVFRY